MERNVQVFGGRGGASTGGLGSFGATTTGGSVSRERLVLRNSNPFMESLSIPQNKKVLSSSSSSSIFSSSFSATKKVVAVPVSSPVAPPVKKQDEEKSLPKNRLSFEEEQALITARNDFEEKRRIVAQHHKLALKANNMGVFHERIGRLDKAFQCYQVSLKALGETKGYKRSTKCSSFSSSFSASVIPQSVKTPIVVNMKSSSSSADQGLEQERTFLTAVTMCNLGGFYRRSGRLCRAMEFYNLAYKTLGTSPCDDDTSEELQARMFEYIEGNVMLVSDEQRRQQEEEDELGLLATDDESDSEDDDEEDVDDEDCSDDRMEI